MNNLIIFRLLVSLAFFLTSICLLEAQVSITSGAVVGYSTANEGEVYLTSDTDELYLGLQDGSLRKIGNDPFQAQLAEYGISSAVNVTAAPAIRDFFQDELTNEGAISKTSDNTLSVVSNGLYQIHFNCRLRATTTWMGASVRLRINGADIGIMAHSGFLYSGFMPDGSWNFTHTLRLNASDTIQLYTQREDTGGGGVITAQTNFTRFTISKIGE
ncbi:hypothetical protein [Sediminicola luteus]|uniref:Uncharacterized protein n=1 Tax=Sediminicola luteus TaxID=319238 RepID=A0A2A4GEQ3_9FLAO|nr:hypothetical protein [Sediminicola luteus]PCE66460.1 hypothetical protein B7P33_03965 [Sediminicola luteus]